MSADFPTRERRREEEKKRCEHYKSKRTLVVLEDCTLLVLALVLVLVHADVEVKCCSHHLAEVQACWYPDLHNHLSEEKMKK